MDRIIFKNSTNCMGANLKNYANDSKSFQWQHARNLLASDGHRGGLFLAEIRRLLHNPEMIFSTKTQLTTNIVAYLSTKANKNTVNTIGYIPIFNNFTHWADSYPVFRRNTPVSSKYGPQLAAALLHSDHA